MKKSSKILWGIILIAVGALIALNSFGITNINIFFDGWWTLFIIVPCLFGLFSEREKTGNIIGIAIGVFLLLCCQNILSFSLLFKLVIPVVIIRIGLKLILGSISGDKSTKIIKEIKEKGEKLKEGFAIFSGQDLNFNGEAFSGAELTAVFGGIECDLRGALIEKDSAIKVFAIFGGIDIFVPENVNVKVNSTSIFGGVSNKTHKNSDENASTIYVSGICMFGGVDIK